MHKLILVIAVLLVSLASSVHARCMTDDAWRGPDKKKHLVVGLSIGAAGALVFKDPRAGFWAGAAAGAAVELGSAITRRGTCSLQDFVVTAVGAAAGAYGVAWLILPQRGGVQVAMARSF